MQESFSKNVQLVLDILTDEIKGDVESALKKLDSQYTMTWVYQGYDKKLFPKTKKSLNQELGEVYHIKGRKYDIKHVAEGKGVVMVELVESYPDQKTKKMYRTPLVLVLEMKRGKIARGRHYCDPRLSYMYLKPRQIQKVFK